MRALLADQAVDVTGIVPGKGRPAPDFTTKPSPALARMTHDSFIYILRDKGRSTLYVRVPDDLPRRVWEHRNPERASFVERSLHRAGSCGAGPAGRRGVGAEEAAPGWRRVKMRALIEAENPRWEDLSGVWAWPG